MVSHISCVAISPINVTLKVNDGDSGHAMPHTIHQQKEVKKTGLLLPKYTYPIYCSVLLNFLARYLADALLGILTMDSSLP